MVGEVGVTEAVVDLKKSRSGARTYICIGKNYYVCTCKYISIYWTLDSVSRIPGSSLVV